MQPETTGLYRSRQQETLGERPKFRQRKGRERKKAGNMSSTGKRKTGRKRKH